MSDSSGLVTAEEYANLRNDDRQRDELIHGRVVSRPLRGGRRGANIPKIASILWEYRQRNGGMATIGSGFIAGRNPDSVLGPDCSFWIEGRAPKDTSIWPETPPDFVVEVVDFHEDDREYLIRKCAIYQCIGVPLIGIVDPEFRTVTVYRPNKPAQTLEEAETLTGDTVLPGFSCRVSEFFE